MKIGLIQFRSVSRDLYANRKRLLKILEKLSEFQLDLILSPELALSGYATTDMLKIAEMLDEDFLKPFQDFSNRSDTTLCLGMPRIQDGSVKICMPILQANKEIVFYDKTLLHKSEQAFFTAGKLQLQVEVKGQKYSPAICYEALQPTHLERALNANSKAYLVSVAKDAAGMEKSIAYFNKASKTHHLPVFLCNAVGESESFENAGQSSVWNAQGEMKAQLSRDKEEFLLYDISLDKEMARGLI